MRLLAGRLGSFQKETTGKTSHLNRLPHFKELLLEHLAEREANTRISANQSGELLALK